MMLKRHEIVWLREALMAEVWRFRAGVRRDPLADERRLLLEGAAHVLAEGEPLVPLKVVPEEEEEAPCAPV